MFWKEFISIAQVFSYLTLTLIFTHKGRENKMKELLASALFMQPSSKID
jgi:hypothetical protein